MRIILILLALTLSNITLKSNPYAMALNKLKADSTFYYHSSFASNEGIYIWDSIIVAIAPYRQLQFVKYDLRGKSFREKNEYFTKDSIFQSFKNLGRKNYFSPQLKEIKEHYKQSAYSWELFFYEPEKYNDKVYLVGLLCNGSYDTKPPYYIQPYGKFAQIIWVFNEDMTEILSMTYMRGTME